MAKRQGERATQVDHHVGARIRERRIMLGMTQEQLAREIGITYQQEHKYERGVNRVSASRLYQISQVLRTPVAYFFEGVGGSETRRLSARERLTLEMVRTFGGIADPRLQEAISELTRSLAEPRALAEPGAPAASGGIRGVGGGQD
jgi:transcriptional regulator with XRE-family HTH domain